MENTGDDSNLGKDIGDQVEDPPPYIAGGSGSSAEKGSNVVKRFSEEAREALRDKGFVIYELNGESIEDQVKAGRQFWSDNHFGFDSLPSRSSEVAINPNQLFLPHAKQGELAYQEKLLEVFNDQASNRIAGVEAVVGSAPDYTSLAFAHLDATTKKGEPDYLFGENYGCLFTRTSTPNKYDDRLLVHVGNFTPQYGGLRVVDDWYKKHGYQGISLAPLFVPV